MREPRLGLVWSQGGHETGHEADTKRTRGGHEADTRRTRGGHEADTKQMRCGHEADTKQTRSLPPLPPLPLQKRSGHEVETKPPQPQFGYKAARRPKATYQDCFSTGRDIIIKHLLEVRRQDYKFLAQLLFNIKL